MMIQHFINCENSDYSVENGNSWISVSLALPLLSIKAGVITPVLTVRLQTTKNCHCLFAHSGPCGGSLCETLPLRRVMSWRRRVQTNDATAASYRQCRALDEKCPVVHVVPTAEPAMHHCLVLRVTCGCGSVLRWLLLSLVYFQFYFYS